MIVLDRSQDLLDYDRIEKAISFLAANHLEQPDLAIAAKSVHMSEFHFQRVFTRWAGISPKRFLQFLTVEYAKQQLAASETLLDTALESGLSGPGRLHDLFVTLEAVTPGEFKTRGEGIEIHYGFHATPFGRCLLGVTSRGICWLSFTGDKTGENAAVRELTSHWSGARCVQNRSRTQAVVPRIFGKLGNGKHSPLSLLVMGTNFQLKVWGALLRIPAGSLISYEGIGEMIAAPQASRAIGSAIGSNCISYLIPCHRVIRKTGIVGGYRWGEARKRALLGWEAAVADHR
jgi:AraC family transcriptional regulator of adaptative response/methylated-DNA-[protein]-cysteine methyltransferase